MGGAVADVRLWLLPAMRIAGGRGFIATTPREPLLPGWVRCIGSWCMRWSSCGGTVRLALHDGAPIASCDL